MTGSDDRISGAAFRRAYAPTVALAAALRDCAPDERAMACAVGEAAALGYHFACAVTAAEADAEKEAAHGLGRV